MEQFSTGDEVEVCGVATDVFTWYHRGKRGRVTGPPRIFWKGDERTYGYPISPFNVLVHPLNLKRVKETEDGHVQGG